MIPIVQDIVFLSISVGLTLILVIFIKNWWIRVKSISSDIVSIHAIAGSTLILIITIYEILQPAVEWVLVDFLLLTIALNSVSMLIFLVTKRLRRNVEGLRVAVMKLRDMETALRRLDSLPCSEQCNSWLKKEEGFQREIMYHGHGYMNVCWRAGQMLTRASDLLVQGDNFLHPKQQLLGGMNLYKKMATEFMENPKFGLLGIWGTGSVGKTSLLKLIIDYTRSEYAENSFQVLLVIAGIGCTSVGQVQKAIATSMGLPLESNETFQAKQIHHHLKDKSFLLLLDDLWEYLDLNVVGIPYPQGTVLLSPDPEEGLERQIRRKVVFTSRYMHLCEDMGCSHGRTIRMTGLDEDDAQNLLSRGWSVFSRPADIQSEQKKSGARKQLSRPQPDTSSEVQQPRRPRNDGLPGGMTDYYEKVCSFIESEGAKSVLMGIWGMRGVGKTTLLRFVHDSYTCFDHIMFVGAGTGDMAISNVQHAIAISLGLDWGMMSSLDELSRGEHIFNHLEHKSFLLLLDDIRDPLNWWVIGLPISSHRHQKIILATRSRTACELMGCDEVNTMEMHFLGEDDAWKLFNDNDELDEPRLRHLRKQMVTKCGGLPLALCSLGRAMSNKRDPREWRCVYNQIVDMELQPWEIDDKVGILILNPPPKKTSEQIESTSREIARSRSPPKPKSYAMGINVSTSPDLPSGPKHALEVDTTNAGCVRIGNLGVVENSTNAPDLPSGPKHAHEVDTTNAGCVRIGNLGVVENSTNAGFVRIAGNLGVVENSKGG